MNWGYYIGKLIEEAGLTQQQIAERSGLKRAHISNIVRGVYKTYKPETIANLAKGLGKTTKEIIDYIYDRETEKPKDSDDIPGEIHLTCVHNGNTYHGSLKLLK